MPERSRSSSPSTKRQATWESDVTGAADVAGAARGASQIPEEGPLPEEGAGEPVDAPTTSGAKEDVPAQIAKREHDQETGAS